MISKAKLVVEWCKTWRGLPVISWIIAADRYRNGRFAEAANYYRRGLAKYPDHPASFCARLDLASCLFRTGNYQDSREILTKIVSAAPNLREAHIRLAHLQSWTGQYMEAVWTLRRAMRELGADAELVAAFLSAVIDNGGPRYLLKEGLALLGTLSDEARTDPKFEVVMARIAIARNEAETGLKSLARLASGLDAPFEAVVSYAEALLKENRVAHARQQLRRALLVVPNHPKVLSLMASSYLQPGPFFNPDYAMQLAVSACQNTGWAGPREMHILAEAYQQMGDKITALAIAHKAREVGSKLLGSYRHVKTLEKLIDNLSGQ